MLRALPSKPLWTQRRVQSEQMGSACPGTAVPSDLWQGWQRRTQTSSRCCMCVKNPATFLQFGGSVSIWWEPMDRNRVLGAVLEPGEAGKSYPGSAGQGHLPLPQSSLALKREMPCSGRATLHMDFIPLPFVPVSSVVCLIWSCLSLFHKSTPATRSPMDGVTGTGNGKGPRVRHLLLLQRREDAGVVSGRCFCQ